VHSDALYSCAISDMHCSLFQQSHRIASSPMIARCRCWRREEENDNEVAMPIGTKRGYALILASATLVAVAAGLLVCWAAGAFDGPVGLAAWSAILLLLGLGWTVGGMLVSVLFLGARFERNSSLYEATAARRATASGRPQQRPRGED
jgi:hypothetical protein